MGDPGVWRPVVWLPCLAEWRGRCVQCAARSAPSGCAARPASVRPVGRRVAGAARVSDRTARPVCLTVHGSKMPGVVWRRLPAWCVFCFEVLLWLISLCIIKLQNAVLMNAAASKKTWLIRESCVVPITVWHARPGWLARAPGGSAEYGWEPSCALLVPHE